MPAHLLNAKLHGMTILSYDEFGLSYDEFSDDQRWRSSSWKTYLQAEGPNGGSRSGVRSEIEAGNKTNNGAQRPECNVKI
jgi:hypothetical protein